MSALSQVVHSFPRNDNEEIQMSLRKYKGRYYIDLRLWYHNEEEPGFKPTKKGVFFSVEQIGELKKGVDRLFQAADEIGSEKPIRKRPEIPQH